MCYLLGFRKYLLFISPFFIYLPFALANDSFSETGIGGLAIGKTDKISMISEKLFLSLDKVEVEYEFQNHSNQAIQALVSFPLPAVRICDEDGRDSGHCNDEEVLDLKFDTWIDGKKAKPARFVEQIVANDSDKKDYAVLLKKFGLSRLADLQSEAKILKMSEKDKKELEDAGLISWQTWVDKVLWDEFEYKDGSKKYFFKDQDITQTLNKMNYQCLSPPECNGHVNLLREEDKLILSRNKWIVLKPKRDLIQKWQVRKVFYWDQEFKPKKILKVKHSYKPITGAALYLDHAVNDASRSENSEFCIDSATKDGILKKAKLIQAPDSATGYSWLKYILKSANSWDGPIKSFELTIKKSDKKQILSTCFNGLKKLDEVTFKANLNDFVPTEDISVLFF